MTLLFSQYNPSVIMDAKTFKQKLLTCKTFDEARPILETMSVGPIGVEHVETAFSIQTKQPTVASRFLNTVIQEVEDNEEKEKEKKMEETDGGTSHQSSSTTGLEKEGTEVKAPEAASEQYDKKDQMGVPINESYPPQMMPPPQQMQGGSGGCGGQMPTNQMPPQQQQMQYTINETVRRALAPIHEAIKQLDKKIQETQKEIPRSLEIGSSISPKVSPPSVIKETTGNPKTDLATTRKQIKQLNDLMNSGKF